MMKYRIFTKSTDAKNPNSRTSMYVVLLRFDAFSYGLYSMPMVVTFFSERVSFILYGELPALNKIK